MENKENVCVHEKGAEQVAKATEGTGKELGCPVKEDSTTPKKFKDADALARAYGALEAEFTRRSQRIKELEKEVETLKAGAAEADSGAEKLRKNAEARRMAAKEFDRFVLGLEKNGDALSPGTKDGAIAEKTAATAVGREVQTGKTGQSDEVESLDHSDSLRAEQTSVSETKGAKTAESVLNREKVATARGDEGYSVKETLQERVKGLSVVGEKEELSSEELYARVSRDEGVRLKIIGEYLTSLGKNAPPLTAGGVGAMLAPPLRAKSIADAGNLALQYLKKPFDL